MTVDRRSFLALGAGAVAWVATGCRTSSSPAITGNLSVIPTGIELAVGDRRNAFVLLEDTSPVTPDGVTATLTPPDGDPADLTLSVQRIRQGIGGHQDHEHPEGTEVLDIFAFTHELDAAGVWTVDVQAGGARAEASFAVVPTSGAPVIGETAIASQSPTVDAPLDADPVCTRDPVCAMHDVTIAAALAASKPLVVTFATPRFCTSRTCGPVVDVLEDEAERVGDAATFIHVEVWKTPDSVGEPDGSVDAFAEWGLGTEPWTYFIGADGVVRDRWLGPFGTEEIASAVDALLEA